MQSGRARPLELDRSVEFVFEIFRIEQVQVHQQASKALSRTRAPGQRCDFGSGSDG